VILSMLGVRHVVLAVNKMDRVGWSRDAFGAIELTFRELATDLGFVDIACIPVAAKSGDNVTRHSEHVPWYRGPSLLDYLEAVEPVRTAKLDPFRMPIQWVNRPDPDFRGYSGLITSGEVRVGMPVKVFPAGRVTHIARIVTFDGDLGHATAGRSVTLTFTDPLDASRGDMVAEAERAPAVTQRVHARIFWMKDRPLEPGQNYLFKLATRSATARVEARLSVIDLDTRRAVAADAIGPNEVGHCTLTFDRPIALDRYENCKDTGSFILIDPESFDTVAMGCVDEIAPPQSRSRLATWLPKRAGAVGGKLTRWTESHARSFVKAVSWRATGSLDTFVVTFVISGSTKLAGSVALTEILTKILIYYGHERLWALVPWGRRQAES
jgi:sulfate adenylyltransferase subunit 1 (EFTu-like GTPase family)/uncharacterized membrane protein